MNTATHNYSHFYVLLKEMPFSGDRTELKEMLIYRGTVKLILYSNSRRTVLVSERLSF